MICQLLCAGGYSVCALIHRKSDYSVFGVQYQLLDFTNSWNEDVLPRDVDVIIHLAQSNQFRDFPEGALDVFKVNIDSTARLLDYGAKIGIEKFIYASSGGVYGKGSEAFGENSAISSPGQLGYYFGSKASSEILVHSYTNLFNIIVLRPFFMYGSGQRRDMLIPRLMDNIISGRAVILQGKEGICINPIHVRDAGLAVSSALGVDYSATFNIAGPNVLTIKEICEIIGTKVNKKPVFEIIDDRPKDLVADISAMRTYLHDPQIQFRDGIEDLIN
jgi:nucleoside-diphosphate-sugar epimerase